MSDQNGGAHARKTLSKRAEYVVTIIVNLIILFVFNNLRAWGVSFLTDDFDALLWIFNLAVGVTIIANMVYLTYDPRWFVAATKLVASIISLSWLYRLYQVFPFDFGESVFPVMAFSWDTIGRIVLIFAMVGTAIAILVEFLRWVGAVIGITKGK